MILLSIVISSSQRTLTTDLFMDAGIPLHTHIHTTYFLTFGDTDQFQHASLTKPLNSFLCSMLRSLASQLLWLKVIVSPRLQYIKVKLLSTFLSAWANILNAKYWIKVTILINLLLLDLIPLEVVKSCKILQFYLVCSLSPSVEIAFLSLKFGSRGTDKQRRSIFRKISIPLQAAAPGQVINIFL